jgi:undecaprenyl-diphosphatase
VNSRFDAGLYRWVIDLAQRSPQPLDDTVRFFSDYGLGLFAVLMLFAWWRARSASADRMAAALAVPLVVVAAYLANDVFKSLVTEQRPCQTLHITTTVESCPALGDWSFPSNHAAIAAAAAVALLLADRRLGLIALPIALLLAASRVWIGVHYPHDVLVGVATGALVAWPLMVAARHATPAVARLRDGRLRPVLAAP